MLSMHESLVPFQTTLTKGQMERILKTWEDGGLLDHDWANVPKHMAAVGAMTMAIAEMIAPDQAGSALLASLLHDAYKRREKEAINAAQAADRDVSAEYDKQAKTQGRFLLDHGYNRAIVEAAQSVGHTSLWEFLNNPNISLLRKIVHLADDLTDGNSFPPLEISMQERRKRYPTIHKDGPTRYRLPGFTIDVQERIANDLLNEFSNRAEMPTEIFYDSIVERAKEILST